MSLFNNHNQNTSIANPQISSLTDEDSQYIEYAYDLDGLYICAELNKFKKLLDKVMLYGELFTNGVKKKYQTKKIFIRDRTVITKKDKYNSILLMNFKLFNTTLDIFILYKNEEDYKFIKKSIKKFSRKFMINFLANDNKSNLFNFLLHKKKQINIDTVLINEYINSLRKYFKKKNSLLAKSLYFLIEGYGFKKSLSFEDVKSVITFTKQQFNRQIHKYINIIQNKFNYNKKQNNLTEFYYIGLNSNLFNQSITNYKPLYLNNFIQYNCYTDKITALNYLYQQNIFKLNIYNSMIYNIVDSKIWRRKFPNISFNILLNILSMKNHYSDSQIKKFISTLEKTLDFINILKFNFDYRIEISTKINNRKNIEKFFNQFKVKHFIRIPIDLVYSILDSSIKTLISAFRYNNRSILKPVIAEIVITEYFVKGSKNRHILPKNIYDLIINNIKNQNFSDILNNINDETFKEESIYISKSLIKYSTQKNIFKKKSYKLLKFLTKSDFSCDFLNYYLEDMCKKFSISESVNLQTDKSYDKEFGLNVYISNFIKNQNLQDLTSVKILNILINRGMSISSITDHLNLFLYDKNIRFLLNTDIIKNSTHCYKPSFIKINFNQKNIQFSTENFYSEVNSEFQSKFIKKSKFEYSLEDMKRYISARNLFENLSNPNKRIIRDPRFLFSFSHDESHMNTLYKKIYCNKKIDYRILTENIYFSPNEITIDVFKRHYLRKFNVKLSIESLKKIDILIHANNNMEYTEKNSDFYEKLVDFNSDVKSIDKNIDKSFDKSINYNFDNMVDISFDDYQNEINEIDEIDEINEIDEKMVGFNEVNVVKASKQVDKSYLKFKNIKSVNPLFNFVIPSEVEHVKKKINDDLDMINMNKVQINEELDMLEINKVQEVNEELLVEEKNSLINNYCLTEKGEVFLRRIKSKYGFDIFPIMTERSKFNINFRPSIKNFVSFFDYLEMTGQFCFTNTNKKFGKFN